MRSLLSFAFVLALVPLGAGAVDLIDPKDRSKSVPHALEFYGLERQPVPHDAPGLAVEYEIPFVTERFGFRWAPLAERELDNPLSPCRSLVVHSLACM